MVDIPLHEERFDAVLRDFTFQRRINRISFR